MDFYKTLYKGFILIIGFNILVGTGMESVLLERRALWRGVVCFYGYGNLHICSCGRFCGCIY